MGASDALVLYRNRINCYPPCRGAVIFKNGPPSVIVECFYFLFRNCIFLGKQWLWTTTYLLFNTILPLNYLKKNVHASVESIVVYPIFSVRVWTFFSRLVRHLLLQNLTFSFFTILDIYSYFFDLIEPAFRGGSCKKCLLNLIGSLQSGSLRSCNRLH